MSHVFKRGNKYSGRYRVLDDPKWVQVPLHTVDKRIAETRLREIIREKEREAVGEIAPALIRNAAQQSLSEHLNDFIADLEARKRSDGYIRKIEQRIKSLIAECGWEVVGHVSASGFTAWRSQKEASAKTLNAYLEAWRVFLGWMVEQDKLEKNPLSAVRKVKQRGKETFTRRALTVEECQKLLSVAEPEHRLMMMIPMYSALRPKEISALRWSDLHLVGNSPCVKLRAEITKNSKNSFVLLHRDLAEALRKVRPENYSPAQRVFPNGVPRNRVFRPYYKAAGIPIMDEDNRKMDFYALRHTCCRLLHLTGAPAKVIMSVMRHSSMDLSFDQYAHLQTSDTQEAISGLPSLLPEESLSHILSHEGVSEGQSVSRFDKIENPLRLSQSVKNEHSSSDLTQADTG